MAGPAAAAPAAGKLTAPSTALRVGHALPAGGGRRPDDDDGDGGRGRLWWIAGALLAVPLLLVALMIALLGGIATENCTPTAVDPRDPGGPGSLGGVAGTGLSHGQIQTVRQASPYASDRLIAGEFLTTAYGPPWGGINGPGIAASGGIRINGGAPRMYIVAVDPQLVGHGQLVYLWPNPFGWRGPFLAADTGTAINQRRIDFYDWRSRASQLAWGRRTARLSGRPLLGGIDPVDLTDPVSVDPAPITAGPGSPDCASGGRPAGPAAGVGATGPVTVMPGADRPGVPTRPEVLAFLRRVAGITGAITLTTGTAHSQFSASGLVSDHWVGLAADLGSVANRFAVGDRDGRGTLIAAAALEVAGIPAHRALQIARAGGLHNLCSNGWRVQVIWLASGHDDHVHIGLRPGCQLPAGVQTHPY